MLIAKDSAVLDIWARNKVWVFLCLFAVVVFVYSFMISAEYKTMDDEVSIVKNEDIRSWSNVGKLLTTSFFGGNAYYRPLVSLSFMAEYHLFGLQARYYYITNILLHVAASFVCYQLMILFLKRFTWAFAVSLLFAIHPIHWEAVSNIPGRAILLSAFFALLAFYYFCLSLEGKGGIRYRVLSWIGFALSLMSKESGGVLPLLMFSYLYFLGRKPFEPVWRWSRPLIPFFIIEGIYIGVRHMLGITKLFYYRSVGEAALGFVTFLRSVLTHVRLFVFPVDLQFDRSRPLFFSLWDGEALATILVFLLMAVLFIKWRRRFSPLTLFLMSWFWIEMMPVSQCLVSIGVQPGYISTAEHFLYSPSIGVFALAVMGGHALGQRILKTKILSPWGWRVIIIGGYLYLMIMTIQANMYSRQELAMLQRSLDLAPYNARLQVSMGLLYAKKNRFSQAEYHFRKTVEYAPDNARGRIGLGKALIDQGKYWEGIAEYEKVTDAGNLSELLADNKKAAYQILTNLYQGMINKDPGNADAYYSLGVVLTKLDEIDSSIEVYTKALKINPSHRNALFNLGYCLATQGRSADAAVAYERIIGQADPGDGLQQQTYFQLSLIYDALGDRARASEYRSRAQER
jgi:tetratricopeptide (TPR) repeat protein